MIDFIGKKIGKLTVVAKSNKPNKQGKSIYWTCKCECGNIKDVKQDVLISNKIKSCNCETGRFRDLTGKKFGRLTVIRRDYEAERKKIRHPTCWVCKCECGREKTMRASGLLYYPTKSCGLCNSGPLHHRWKGGRHELHGYIALCGSKHPNSRKGRIMEHVLVMSQKIGRPLIKGETVHHLNGIKHDNRPENLELWNSNHTPGQKIEDLYNYALELIALYGPLFEK